MTKYALLGAALWKIRSKWFRKFRCDHTIASNKFTYFLSKYLKNRLILDWLELTLLRYLLCRFTDNTTSLPIKLKSSSAGPNLGNQ